MSSSNCSQNIQNLPAMSFFALIEEVNRYYFIFVEFVSKSNYIIRYSYNKADAWPHFYSKAHRSWE